MAIEYIPAKTIVSGYAENNAWFGTNYNMNIYKGCCHGCIYCDSRSECYHIEEFDRVRAKKDALSIINRELASKQKGGVVGTGSMSDPYNPFEKQLKLTRGALELVARHGFGIAIATKGALVQRDADVLASIARHNPALVKLTVTTTDDALASKLEPHAPPPSRRLEAIEALSKAGIFTGVLMMPVLPFIEDSEENILSIIRRAEDAGVRFIFTMIGVTLRQNQREYFLERAESAIPGTARRYIETFGNSYECASPRAKALYAFFEEQCQKRGLLYKMPDIISAYKAPYQKEQLSLF